VFCGDGFAGVGRERRNREKGDKNQRLIWVAAVCFQSLAVAFDYVSLAIDLDGGAWRAMRDQREAGRDWRSAFRERRTGLHGFAAAAPGGGGNCPILIATSYFGCRLKPARRECENSCTRGWTWDRNGTEPVRAVQKWVATCTFARGADGCPLCQVERKIRALQLLTSTELLRVVKMNRYARQVILTFAAPRLRWNENPFPSWRI